MSVDMSAYVEEKNFSEANTMCFVTFQYTETPLTGQIRLPWIMK